MTNRPDQDATADTAAVRPMQRDYLSAQVAQALEARISEGAYTPGTKLPSEARLCAEFGVSRTVMREAVSGLKSRGKLNSSQGRGVYVSEGAHLAPLALDPKAAVSAEAVLKLLELRAGFEVQACVLAARRHTAIQLQRIREQLDSVAAAVRAGDDGIAQDHAFHCAICAATDNEHYLAIEKFLFQYSRVGSRVSRADTRRGIRYATQTDTEHARIYRAIAKRDETAAAAAAQAHMHAVAERVRGADQHFWDEEAQAFAHQIVHQQGLLVQP
jgi:GntR family transcriptional regulator, transcriptional repressor for pyruvate dehydrogenase complex